MGGERLSYREGPARVHRLLAGWYRKFLLSLFSIQQDETVFVGSKEEYKKFIVSLFKIAEEQNIAPLNVVWTKFPNCCPYCLAGTCECRGAYPRHRSPKKEIPFGFSPREAQVMLTRIYPRTCRASIDAQLDHISEEVGELLQEIRVGHVRRKLEDEWADVIARVLQLATGMGIEL